jgi:hypothetical protein
MKCYKVTVRSIIVISAENEPPDLWDYKILLGEISQQPVMDVTVEEMTTEATTPPQRKCGACGTLGHNRQTCPNE